MAKSVCTKKKLKVVHKSVRCINQTTANLTRHKLGGNTAKEEYLIYTVSQVNKVYKYMYVEVKRYFWRYLRHKK